MHHEFECQSPADAEERAAAAIRSGIAMFGKDNESDRLDENATSVLAEYVVDQLVDAGFLPADPRPSRPFSIVR